MRRAVKSVLKDCFPAVHKRTSFWVKNFWKCQRLGLNFINIITRSFYVCKCSGSKLIFLKQFYIYQNTQLEVTPNFCDVYCTYTVLQKYEHKLNGAKSCSYIDDIDTRGVDFTNILQVTFTRKVLNSIKRHWGIDCLFELLRYECIKIHVNILMKLTLTVQSMFYFGGRIFDA